MFHPLAEIMARVIADVLAGFGRPGAPTPPRPRD